MNLYNHNKSDNDSFINTKRNAQEKLGFYIAASDQELLQRVTSIVDRFGSVGLMDTAGRVQYLIDGRKGSPYAARRISEVADKLICREADSINYQLHLIHSSVDEILKTVMIKPRLKGYHYLRYMLQQTAANPSLLRPVSKTLYPETAADFKVKPAQVERDIRYALKTCCDKPLSTYSNTTAICYLHDLTIAHMREIERNKRPDPV